MYDLIVIGGGFWGSMTALHAQKKGLSVLLLDDLNPQGASRNAAGIISLGWYQWRQTRDKKDVVGNIFGDLFTFADAAYGVGLLRDYGLLRQTGEEMFTLAGNRRFRQDLWLLSSPQELFELAERKQRQVERLVREDGRWRVQTAEVNYFAQRVVIAAGAFTDDLLVASGLSPIGVKGLRGRGLLIQPHKVFDVPHTVQVAPYSHLTLRPWKGGLARVGDTVEKKPAGDERLEPLKDFAAKLAPQYEITKVFDGLRPVTEKAFIQLVAPDLVVATGGHRVGLALAPAAAVKALALLGVKA
jgi:glycine/D-amino acid oxidase-like deaminating enzyme